MVEPKPLAGAGDPYNGPGFSPYAVRSTDMLSSSVYMEWSVKIDQRFKDILQSAYDAGYARSEERISERSDDPPTYTFDEWLAKTLEENSGH
jgi:hypothetical protein